MGVDVHNFVSALNCVMAQRLVRLVCPRCKQTERADAAMLEAAGLDPRQYAKQAWAEGKGCEYCHQTGYHGRAAITEFLDLSPRIRQLIVDRAPAASLQAAAVEEGMITLRQSAVAKAVAGETTLREINRVTFVD
ncbi:MAG: pilus assembly protein PilB, partial [Pseudomonadota bacterium]